VTSLFHLVLARLSVSRSLISDEKELRPPTLIAVL
jgi:hypothetical protein